MIKLGELRSRASKIACGFRHSACITRKRPSKEGVESYACPAMSCLSSLSVPLSVYRCKVHCPEKPNQGVDGEDGLAGVSSSLARLLLVPVEEEPGRESPHREASLVSCLDFFA